MLSDELRRYQCQIILPEIGLGGQKKLKRAKVLIVGMGGLGAPASMYLAAAGVGTIGIIDCDDVDLSNLHRQIVYSTKDIGKRKTTSAKRRLIEINPEIKVVAYDTILAEANAKKIIKDYDIIIDGADNFSTRYFVNDACVLLKKPYVYGAVFKFEGQVSIFVRGSCYRCLQPRIPNPLASCEGGVLGVLPGIIGAIQATEAVKLILGRGEPLIGKLLVIDALKMEFRKLILRKNPDCPICGKYAT